MRDPYDILGVSRSATAEEIKSAYRKLAKKLHPDVNPGKKDIEQKFKEVTTAYDLLSDKDKRARFDRGEIDAQGNERGFGGYGSGRGPFGGNARARNRSGAGAGADPFSGFNADNIDDILNQFMGGGMRGGAGGGARATKGNDVSYALTVPFIDATIGCKRRVTLESGKTIDVTIPPGTESGHKLRLRSQGQAGPAGNGDAIIEIQVEPHSQFSRNGNDITLEAPVSVPEAVLGASIQVPTVTGHVTVKVPAGANTGTTLRLKGKGVPKSGGDAGDMFVKLKLMLPEPIPEDFAEIIEKWSKKHDYNPRKKLGWAQ